MGWAALMGLLCLAWVNSPAVGTFPGLLAWTPLAVAAAVGSGRWLVGTSLLPRRGWAAMMAALWLLLLWTAWVKLGSTWILDGLILREPRWTDMGRVLKWLPFAVALLFTLAMLALSLEARYRLLHPEKYPARGAGGRG